MEVSRPVTEETGASRCRPSQWAAAIRLKSSSAAVRVCDRGAEVEVVVKGIKRFRINFSEAPAKCRFPRPPLPGGPSPLKSEKPECLRQCERWSRVGTGTRRSAASHQCRLTDGSIQPAAPQRLNAWSKKTHRSHMRDNSFCLSSEV